MRRHGLPAAKCCRRQCRRRFTRCRGATVGRRHSDSWSKKPASRYTCRPAAMIHVRFYAPVDLNHTMAQGSESSKQDADEEH